MLQTLKGHKKSIVTSKKLDYKKLQLSQHTIHAKAESLREKLIMQYASMQSIIQS